MSFVLKNWYLFLALGVVLSLLLAPLVRQRMSGIRSLVPAEAVQLINRENGVVVDVCEPQEFSAGHIVRALNVPLSALNTRTAELEKYRDRPLILSCRSGNRSLKAAFALRRAGFQKVYSLAGGLIAWQSANLPVEK